MLLLQKQKFRFINILLTIKQNRMFKNTINLYQISLHSLKHNFNRSRNMLIHHGLMGNSKNFRSISKNISFSSYVNSELIDCRNHGQSPHTDTHTIEDLADDLHELLNKRINSDDQWKRVTLMGHSMGAMAIMAFTMKYAEMQKYVERSILIDIPCVKLGGQQSWNRTGKFLQSLLEIDLKQQTTKIFSDIEGRAWNKDVANLLKSNLKIISENQHSWIPNLKVIVKDYQNIGNFSLRKNLWKNPVQLIYGDKSHYVNQDQVKIYKDYYPQMNDENFYRVQGAGHWVHFDKTKQFLKIADSILKKDQK